MPERSIQHQSHKRHHNTNNHQCKADAEVGFYCKEKKNNSIVTNTVLDRGKQHQTRNIHMKKRDLRAQSIQSLNGFSASQQIYTSHTKILTQLYYTSHYRVIIIVPTCTVLYFTQYIISTLTCDCQYGRDNYISIKHVFFCVCG